MNQSPELTEFYRVYYAWVMTMMYGSQINPFGFKTNTGLCGALRTFCKGKDFTADQYRKMDDEMTIQFKEAGLSWLFPFDDGLSYSVANAENTMHLNKKRMNWVKEHAQI